MSFLTDLIKQKAGEVLAGKISVPEGIQEQVLGGVAESIFGSVKETAGKSGGVDQLIELFAGYGSQSLALKYLGVPFEHHKICEWAIPSI